MWFDVLAPNYLYINDHPVFLQVIKEMSEQFEITPADGLIFANELYNLCIFMDSSST